MIPIDTLTIGDLTRGIRSGVISARAAVEASLARIEQVEPAVRAWVHVDAAGAREAAKALDADAARGVFRGPLHGVPVGLKDIFDAAGLTTTSGAPSFAHRHPDVDGDAVARLRAAGAVIMGKTTTTEFAYADSTVTCNPWNLEHTPGGSSSGSAAAVAARMIPLALGSQTIGSTLRPAAYCGIVGLKATHGLISAEGVTPLAWSLDHVGIFTRSVDDAAIVLAVLTGSTPTGVDGGASDHRPPRLGIPRALFTAIAGQEVRSHLDAVAASFARGGAAIEDIVVPPSAAALHDAGQVVLRGDVAAYHAALFAVHAGGYRPKIRALVEDGLKIPAVDYVNAQRIRAQFKREMQPIFARWDALLMPVAPTTAPRGFESTGDPSLCAPWSYGGFPSIALPSRISPDRLPLAVQLAAGAGAEDRLLDVARWCEGILAFSSAPPV